jgi:hypothetical protein
MKKTLLFTAALVFGIITFSSCAEEEPLPQPELEEVTPYPNEDDDEDDLPPLKTGG